MKFLRHIGEYPLFWLILFAYRLIKVLPGGSDRVFARLLAGILYPVPAFGGLAKTNLRIAFPDWEEDRIRKTARASLYNVCRNLFEFIWLDGDAERLRQRYVGQPDIVADFQARLNRGERLILITPHLGSWEASGQMAPFFAGVDMAAIAKPVRNRKLNELLNKRNREKMRGLRIIFTKGAVRSAMRALRGGVSLGTLIDQNTRVRDGGAFIDFFGLKCASSLAPCMLKRWCDAHAIPATIVFGACVRLEDDKIHPFVEYLPRPFSEYPDDTAVLQEIIAVSERYVRKYPEQYLWFYHRFRYIPADAPEELAAKYPPYAERVKPKFYRRARGGEK